MELYKRTNFPEDKDFVEFLTKPKQSDYSVSD